MQKEAVHFPREYIKQLVVVVVGLKSNGLIQYSYTLF